MNTKSNNNCCCAQFAGSGAHDLFKIRLFHSCANPVIVQFRAFTKSQNNNSYELTKHDKTRIIWLVSLKWVCATNGLIELAFASASHRKWHSTSIIFYLFARWVSFAPSLFVTLRSEIQFDCVDDWFHFKMTQLTLMWLRSDRIDF